LAGAGLDRNALVDDAIGAAYLEASGLDGGLAYTEAEFSAALAAAKANVVSCALDLEKVLLNSLTAMAQGRRLLAELPTAKYGDSQADIQRQLTLFSKPDLLRGTELPWIQQFPRYMKALVHRLQRISGQYAKDQQHTELLESLAAPLNEALGTRPSLLQQCPAAANYRWMLEELRVSLFAQNLGTRAPVSEKRLRNQWQEIVTWLAHNPH
jgi:ATP-dependent helicase HrpA